MVPKKNVSLTKQSTSLKSKVIYEVNLAVDLDIASAYQTWLTLHVQEMLTFDGFLDATWYERNPQDEKLASNRVYWTIHYQLENRQALENYLTQHASRMREEGISKFGNKFEAIRRILHQR